MKKYVFLALAGLLAAACAPRQNLTVGNGRSSVVVDSTEYEITIIDPDFDRWYLMNYSPGRDHSNEYYRSRNLTGVNNWNALYRQNRYPNLISSYIDYTPGIDYGIEVNRKMYWYFTYIEDVYGVRLL